MRPIPYLLRYCDLFGCNRRATHALDDGTGRSVCYFHAVLFFLGASRVESANATREETLDSAGAFDPDGGTRH